MREINLYGRVVITGMINALTGLHIGKGKEGLMVGGLENSIIRDALTNIPFIPGSSLKGKLRSLAEKRDPTADQNTKLNKNVFIHVCDEKLPDHQRCAICRLFGVPAGENNKPTRLVVRDIFMEKQSIERLESMRLDQPFAEIKYEAAIDRLTAAATPRPMERVPAGTQFGPFWMVFSIYDSLDIDLLSTLIESMHLLEDDYLGGTGSRGSGQIQFADLKFTLKPVSSYLSPAPRLTTLGEYKLLEDVLAHKDQIIVKIKEAIPTRA